MTVTFRTYGTYRYIDNESDLHPLESVVYTFVKHPENYNKEKAFYTLNNHIGKKIEILAKRGLDYVYFEKFDEKYSRIKPEDL